MICFPCWVVKKIYLEVEIQGIFHLVLHKDYVGSFISIVSVVGSMKIHIWEARIQGFAYYELYTRGCNSRFHYWYVQKPCFGSLGTGFLFLDVGYFILRHIKYIGSLETIPQVHSLFCMFQSLRRWGPFKHGVAFELWIKIREHQILLFICWVTKKTSPKSCSEKKVVLLCRVVKNLLTQISDQVCSSACCFLPRSYS